MSTALVLGAGGLTGQAFHLGVLSALQELTGFDGRRADILVGTSAGSLVAAGLGGGISAADMIAELTGETLSPEGAALRAQHVPARAVEDLRPVARGPLDVAVLLSAARRPFGTRPAAVVSSLLPRGRTSTEPIARSLRALHGDTWPDRDLRICAVRTRDARRVVFGTEGAPECDVGTAVAASCAIPGYFTPVEIGGQVFVDGGVHSPTNADVVRHDQPEHVIVLSPMSAGPRPGPRADLPVRLAVRRYLALEVRRLRRSGSLVTVFQPSAQDLVVMGMNPMRGGLAEDVLAVTAQSVRARLEARPELVDALVQQNAPGGRRNVRETPKHPV
ncbi:MAG: Patatin [Frankiales bacterium]|nr:Patatin [Frankiales bacterium]